MKEIVIISGKGGTGKTSLSASFSYLVGEKAIIADCDVDAADMHLLMQPDFEKTEDFFSGELAILSQEECIQCGKCMDVCRFDAVHFENSIFTIDALSCEGCGYCSKVCPTNAITNIPLNVGKSYISNIKTNTKMVHARLGIGSDNSGKLVAKVKKEAKDLAKELEKEYIIVDGSPGVGCPVISSLAGAKFVILVTEPSVSGIHDLKRVHELVKKFKLKAGCIINKSDINEKGTQEIERFLQEENIFYINKLPYSENFTKAMLEGKTIVEYSNDELSQKVRQSWNKIMEHLSTLR